MFGMGGPRMAEAGVELIADYHEVAVVGIAEVLHKIPSVVRVQRKLAREAVRRQASLAILRWTRTTDGILCNTSAIPTTATS